MNLEIINTSRMVARKPIKKDFDVLYRMFSNSKFIKVFGITLPKEIIMSTLKQDIAQWKLLGYGSWVFRDRIDDSFIGIGGLIKKQIDNKNEIKLDYALIPDYWHKGYGLEMAQACLKIGFDKIKLKNIVCVTLTSNISSKRLAEKLGFKYEKNFTYADLSYRLYRMNALDFQNAS